jgi:iron(III) transport system permease protein
MKGRIHFRINFWSVTALIIAALLLIFLAYPLFSLLIRAFRDNSTGEFGLSNFIKFFSKNYYLRGLFNSLTVGCVVTLLAVVIGGLMAYMMTTYRFLGKKVIEILVIISLLSPPFIGAYSWILLSGRSGLITGALASIGIKSPSIYGIGGIIFVLTIKLYPFIYIFVKGALRKIDVSLIEASESLGCHSLQKIFTMVLPLVLPTLLAGSLLVFMNAIADFGTPMVIGEGINVLATMVYTEYINEVGGNANFSAALALIMVLITLLLFMSQKYVVNKKSYAMTSLNPIIPRRFKGVTGVFAHIAVYLVVFISMIPHITVMVTSFLRTEGKIFRNGFSLASYQKVFSSLGKPVINTYTFSLIAIIIIIMLAVLIAYISNRKRSTVTGFIDTITMFPYVLPGSVLGLTLLMAFNKPPLSLSGTAAIIIIAFVIRRLPYTLRSSTAILYQISPSIEEASISLGCGPVKTFFILTTRMMMPGVLSGAILSWVTVVNELSASFLLYSANTTTMSITVYQRIVRMEYGTAGAVATILTLTTILSLFLFFWFTGKTEVSL